jgi:hypothetical protein
MWWDQRFTISLGYQAGQRFSESDGQYLVEMAKAYGIIRNFKVIEEKPRLKAALDILERSQLPTPENAVDIVERLAKELQKIYGKTPLSAASKFLWMRFKSPIIIYDQLANTWLRVNSGYKDDSYMNYCKFWREEYIKRESDIRDACAELATFKQFTFASGVDDITLSEWTRSTWFRERVFDHFMLNATELERLEKPVGAKAG